MQKAPGSASYLSFNPAIDGCFSKDDVATVADLSKDPPLRYTWVLWEQISGDSKGQTSYTDQTHMVAQIGTVKEFWKYWNHLPQPSELLQQKKFVREDEVTGQQHVVDAIMIFREGIRPEWEDKVNAQGGHFQFQLKPVIGGGQVDEYWNNLVLGIVGSTIDPPGSITGIRLVDKLNTARIASIRIEVWYSNFDDKESADLLQKNLEKCMCTKLDGTTAPNAWGKTENKPHTSTSGKK